MSTDTSEIAAHLSDEGLERSAFARLAVEAIAVARGIKPAARFTAPRDRAQEFCKVLTRSGMETAEYNPEPEEWGYRHATRAERRARSVCDVRVYYAPSKTELDAVLEMQRAKDEPELGRMLGYPDCCVGINSLFTSLPMTDMVRVARAAGARDWRLNVFLTEMDVGLGSPYYLISHFPCRLSCPASIGYAHSVFEAVSEAVPRFADQLQCLLSLPVLLRDERKPPDSRRYGNFGCLLHGITVDDNVFYDTWRSLRLSDNLEDAALDRADCLTRDGFDINLLRARTGEVVNRLDGERWQLVTF